MFQHYYKITEPWPALDFVQAIMCEMINVFQDVILGTPVAIFPSNLGSVIN